MIRDMLLHFEMSTNAFAVVSAIAANSEFVTKCGHIRNDYFVLNMESIGDLRQI